MTYFDFIKKELGDVFSNIVKEVGFLNEVDTYETLVLRELQGTIYQNSTILPVQFEVHTMDVVKTLEILNDFAKKNNNGILRGGLTYIKQNYNTPFTSALFDSSGLQINGTITLIATLVYSHNISDIEMIKVDGEVIPFDQIQEDYVALEDNQKEYDEDLSETIIRGGINKITITNLLFANGLLQKVRNIKGGLLSVDSVFSVEIKYIDSNVIYKYNMKLGSHSVISTSANLPMTTIALTE